MLIYAFDFFDLLLNFQELSLIYSTNAKVVDVTEKPKADLRLQKVDENGKYTYKELVQGSALTIEAFSSAFKKINKNFGGFGAWLVTIGITLFAFSTILGWEYHGEKAFEYIFKTHKYNMVYRVVFSLAVYVGATQSLQLVWNFSDIANALMAIPNLICLLAMSGVIAKEVERYLHGHFLKRNM